MKNKIVPTLQIAGTLLILGFVPGNTLKLGFLLPLWILTWGPFRRGSLVIFGACLILFTGMDAMAVHRGVFFFNHPDLWGLPYWEIFMWAFWTYHFHRMIQGPPPPFQFKTLPLAILFSLCFSLFHTHIPLLIATSTVVGIALLFFHEPLDWAYMGYAVLVGTLLEYLGVVQGLWHYPDPPPGGVPFWYIPMWAGIALFMRRLGLPTAAIIDRHFSKNRCPKI